MAANENIPPVFPPDAGDDDIDDDDEDTWGRNLQILLVFNGVVPNDRLPADFIIAPDRWTPFPKPPPFPLNLESTWYLAACLLILLAVHLELDTTWLLQRGYFHWLGRVLFNVFITVAIAVLSMVLYDVLGNCIEFLRRRIWIFILDSMGRYWQTWDGHRPWYITEEVFHFVAAGVQILYDCGLIIALMLLKTAGLKLFGLATIYGEDTNIVLSDEFLVNKWVTSIIIQGPETYGGLLFKAVLWEAFPQFFIQIGIISFLYLLVFLFEIKAMEQVIFGARRRNPVCSIISTLVRATALHIMSGTAYQLISLILAILKTVESQRWPSWDLPIQLHWPVGLINGPPQTFIANIGVAALLYGNSVLVEHCCWLLTSVFLPYWRPYIYWLTLFVEPHIPQEWPEYRRIVEDDTQLVHRRYLFRTIMTIGIGAWSTWPLGRVPLH